MAVTPEIIEAAYKATLPRAYRDFVARGYLDHRSTSHLHVHDVEWFTLEQLLEPDWSLHAQHRHDLLPFAQNGRGDLWCWHTSVKSAANEHPVVMCPHDCLIGHVDAPSFLGWLYSRALSYATGIWYSDSDTRESVMRWANVLREFGESAWAESLERFMRREPFEYEFGPRRMKERGFLSEAELNTAISAAFGPGYVDAPFRWQSDGGTAAG